MSGNGIAGFLLKVDTKTIDMEATAQSGLEGRTEKSPATLNTEETLHCCRPL